MNSLAPATDTLSLPASFAALRQARQRSELIPALHHALQQHTQARALQVMWLEGGSATPLLPTPALPTPDETEHSALAAGEVVQRHTLTYLPMLVGGTLRGWAVLEHAYNIDDARMLVDHAGALLALWEHATVVAQSTTPPRPIHLDQPSQQLAMLDEITTQLRTASTTDQIGTIVADAVRMLTNTPRMLVYLIDPQREWATLHYHEGLDDASVTEVRVPTMRVPDGQQVLAQRYDAIGKHVYRARQRFPNSPFEQNTLLILSDQQHAPVGSVIFDLVAYDQPLDAAFVQTLEVLANGAASALRATWLIDEQQRTVDRLVALNAFSLVATNTMLTPAELLRITVGGAVGTTRALCGGALLLGTTTPVYYCECAAASTCAASIEARLETDAHTVSYWEWENEAVPDPARAAGVGSMICVPLRGTNKTLGYLWMAYRSSVVLPADREMVVLYAKMAGAVLENHDLFGEVRVAHDRFAAIMAASDEGMLMVAAGGEILVANAALHRLLDLPSSELAGTKVDLVLHRIEQQHGHTNELAAALHDVAHGARTAAHGALHRGAGSQRDLVWTVVPVDEGDAAVRAALLLLRDVTAERQASKLRDDLTHMVVHDLRAPLANMIASLDLLLKQRVGPLTPRQERIAQIASEGSHHMAGLVDALLDTRRLERWQWEMCKELHLLYPLVHELCAQWEDAAGARGITFHNDTAALPPLFIDRDLVRRVLQNVLDNAVKFSGANGVVQISGTVAEAGSLPPDHGAGHWARIAVIDSGPGVPLPYRSHIFELFGQAPHGRSRGSGVGLAFCKLAVEAHGGMIWVEDAPNGGAAFTFTLPLA
jgi:PAS domain S-box-containing protein